MAGSKIRQWGSETSASENATAGGLNFAEGQLPSTVNNNVRAMMGQIKDTYSPDEFGWCESSASLSVTNQTTGVLTGNLTSFFTAGRRVRMRGGTATVYATVVSASFTSETTLTVVDTSGSLSGGSMSVIAFAGMAQEVPRKIDKLEISGTLSVGGNAIVTGNLTVAGSATISGTVTVKTALNVSGTLNTGAHISVPSWHVRPYVSHAVDASASTSGTVAIWVVTFTPAPATLSKGLSFRLQQGGGAPGQPGATATRINVNGLGEKPAVLASSGLDLTNSTTRLMWDIIFDTDNDYFVVINA